MRKRVVVFGLVIFILGMLLMVSSVVAWTETETVVSGTFTVNPYSYRGISAYIERMPYGGEVSGSLTVSGGDINFYIMDEHMFRDWEKHERIFVAIEAAEKVSSYSFKFSWYAHPPVYFLLDNTYSHTLKRVSLHVVQTRVIHLVDPSISEYGACLLIGGITIIIVGFRLRGVREKRS